MSSGLDPDEDRQNVGPDLGPNCLLRLSADDENHQLKNIVIENQTVPLLYDMTNLFVFNSQNGLAVRKTVNMIT